MDYEKIDYEKVIEYFNIRNATHSINEVQFSCPFPEHYRGDRNPSAGINKKNGLWHCFSCGRKGTVVTFVAELEGVSDAIATRWIREGFDSSFGRETCKNTLKKAIEIPPKKTVNRPIPKSTLELFTVDWNRAYEAYENKSLPKKLAYIFNRGFSPSTLQRANIGYDTKSHRLTIPLYNSRGDLVGFKGRVTNDVEAPKYLGVGDRETTYYGFPTCKTSEFVYGIESLSPSDDYCIIVEGEFDALMLRQNGFHNAVALGGSNPSESQIKEIRNSANSAVLLFDNDKAGRKAERNLTESLLPFMPLRIAAVSKGKDPAEMTKKQVLQAIKQSKNPLNKLHKGSD